MGQRVEYLMVQNIPANGTRDLFRDADSGESDLRFITQNGTVTMAIVSSAVGIELSIQSQDRNITQRSTLEAGGTTGVFPNMDQKAFTFEVYAGEKLRCNLRETAGVATTDVMAAVSFDPY